MTWDELIQAATEAGFVKFLRDGIAVLEKPTEGSPA